jgi:uncharacterized protein (TIGR03083 family)
MMEIPINTLHLFEPLEQKLIELLKSLTPEDWNKPTLAKRWTVKDVTAHLLDTQLRALALSKNYIGETPPSINSYQELVDYLNQLNADWVNAMKRVNPDELITLLESTQKSYIDYLHTLKPFDQAPFSVAWAGELESYNWFHLAREYTERWHHQQQIREAVNKPGIMNREFYFPLIQTFMMALPYTYRECVAENETVIKVIIKGEEDGEWQIQYQDQEWHFINSTPNTPATIISLSPDTSWKIFTRALSREAANERVTISGNKELGQPFFKMTSVMA